MATGRSCLHTGHCPGNDAGVVTSGNFQGDRLPAGHGYALLGPGNGGVGFNCHSKRRGHATGDAPQDTPVAIGLGPDLTVFQAEGIVVLTAPEPGGGETGPKFHAPDAGIPNTAWAIRFSMPPKMGSPQPGWRPRAAHSMTPPTESPPPPWPLKWSESWRPLPTPEDREGPGQKGSAALLRPRLRGQKGRSSWSPMA